MKRIIMSAVAILLITAAVQAQTDTAKGPRHERRMQKGGSYGHLNLTAGQQAKMKSLREEFKQKHEALKAEKLTEAERKSQLGALRTEHKTAVEAILTPEQKAQLETKKGNRSERMRGGKKMTGDSSTTLKGKAGLKKELDLTADQQAKLKIIRTEFKSKGDALRQDQTFTKEQKQEKLRNLMKQQQAEMKTVLTNEQQEKLQSLRGERAARNTR